MPKVSYNKRSKIIEASSTFDMLLNENNLERKETEHGIIVLLTKKNAEIIEKLVQNDDAYFPFSQIIFSHFGIDKVKTDSDKALFAVLIEIDRENSTNAWRYHRENFYKLISFIKCPFMQFFERLENGDKTLPDAIAKACGSCLKSFSSKVCKYLCDYAFHKDHYYINDTVVRRMLLFYLDFYNVEHTELKSSTDVDNLSYQELYGWLSKLHNARNEEYGDTITKNELDLIIWYCYKSLMN